ncbi:MAG: sulfatase-like hydrolase/transferase, partial [Bacteroidales bacterium]|nr:sulfatase-like hydrolase/transferase [Bacteroidales bacterium]
MKAYLKTLPALAAVLSGCSVPKAERPNIIYLMFDDLGYGDLGCYGQELIETPNIDALAARGIVFTDMYSAAPLSAPSRCSVMTGLHCGHSQIRGNDERWPRPEGMVLSEADWYFDAIHENPDLEGQWPLAEGTATLATMLS